MIQGIELIDWNNFDEIIKFYESNKHIVDNYQDLQESESIIILIDLKLSYCNALISKHHYNDCFDALTHINILVNKLLKDTNEYKIRHERYLFTEGVVLGYLRRYEESQGNFKELVKIDPRNDLYKDWLKANRTQIIAKQSNVVGYTGCIIIFFTILMSILKVKLSFIFDLVGLLSMGLGFGFPYIMRFIEKKDKLLTTPHINHKG